MASSTANLTAGRAALRARVAAPGRVSPQSRLVLVAWMAALGVTGGFLYGVSLLLRDVVLPSLSIAARLSIGASLMDPEPKNISECVAAVLVVALALIAPAFWLKRLRVVRRAFTLLAFHKTQAAIFCGLLPMVIRVALLPVLPA